MSLSASLDFLIRVLQINIRGINNYPDWSLSKSHDISSKLIPSRFYDITKAKIKSRLKFVPNRYIQLSGSARMFEDFPFYPLGK